MEDLKTNEIFLWNQTSSIEFRSIFKDSSSYLERIKWIYKFVYFFELENSTIHGLQNFKNFDILKLHPTEFNLIHESSCLLLAYPTQFLHPDKDQISILIILMVQNII